MSTQGCPFDDPDAHHWEQRRRSQMLASDGTIRPEWRRTSLVGLKRMTRETATDHILTGRLLEKSSDDPIESEVLDVLWEIVQLVDAYDIIPPIPVSSPFPQTISSRVGQIGPECVPPSHLSPGLDAEEEFSISDISSESEEEDEIELDREPDDQELDREPDDQELDREPDDQELDLDHSALSCAQCGHFEEVIISRGFGWEDYLSVRDHAGHPRGEEEEELICQSCIMGHLVNSSENYYCVDCGYSEALCKQFHGDQLGLFYLEGQTRPEYQDENTRCQGCRARVERYEREEREEQGEIRAAFATVDADGIHGRVNRVLFPENDDEEDLVGDDDEWEETYVGELELAEENEDNDEEVASRVKKTVQEMGEILFDIMENISEGDYLKLMDGLQSITNEMNH
jgi:hypothetical protein